MGPLTHAATVSGWVAQHIAAMDRADIRPHRIGQPSDSAFMARASWCPP